MGCLASKNDAAVEPAPGAAVAASEPGLPARAQAQGSTPEEGVALEAEEAKEVATVPAEVDEAGRAVGVQPVDAVASKAPETADATDVLHAGGRRAKPDSPSHARRLLLRLVGLKRGCLRSHACKGGNRANTCTSLILSASSLGVSGR